MTLLEKFLSKIQLIKNLKPRYVSGGSGTNGTCDCVGLIIGALRRAGIKYTGIHGSNWFARKEVTKLEKVNGAESLQVGNVVFQTYEPGQAGYALPGRYKKGGAYYNGDVRDYMHIGVVTSVNPLQITHMWKPTVKVDTSLRWWTYKGWIKKLGAEPKKEEPLPPATPTQECKARVTAPSGKYVKMRKEPTTKCGIYEELPIGAIVTINNPGENWAQISYGKWHGWYMMAKFLQVI